MPSPILTQKQLKEILRYDPDTGIFTWLVRTANCVKIGEAAGGLNPAGYSGIRLKGRDYLAHRLAWLYMTDEWPKDQIDHINHIKDDNRIENLREVTHKENGRNRSMQKNNVSGCCGVCWYKPYNKWAAQIKVNGKQINLGCFDDLNNAIAARKAAEIKYGFHENHGS